MTNEVENHTNHEIGDITVPDQVKRMEVDLPNGYAEYKIKLEQECEDKLSTGDQNKLFDRLVKFVKDKLNTSSLSLAEFKKLILLHQTGKKC